MRVVERKRKGSMSNGVSLRTPSYTDMDLRFTLGEPQGQFNLPQQKNGRYIAPCDNYRAAFAPRQLQFGFRLTF